MVLEGHIPIDIRMCKSATFPINKISIEELIKNDYSIEED